MCSQVPMDAWGATGSGTETVNWLLSPVAPLDTRPVPRPIRCPRWPCAEMREYEEAGKYYDRCILAIQDEVPRPLSSTWDAP